MCLHKIRKDIILNHPKKPEEIGIRYVSIAQFKNCLERKLVQICLFFAEDYVTVVVINIQSILIKWIKLMGIKDSKVFIVSRVDEFSASLDKKIAEHIRKMLLEMDITLIEIAHHYSESDKMLYNQVWELRNGQVVIESMTKV